MFKPSRTTHLSHPLSTNSLTSAPADMLVISCFEQMCVCVCELSTTGCAVYTQVWRKGPWMWGLLQLQTHSDWHIFSPQLGG